MHLGMVQFEISSVCLDQAMSLHGLQAFLPKVSTGTQTPTRPAAAVATATRLKLASTSDEEGTGSGELWSIAASELLL